MHFGIKSTLKNNHNHTFKQAIFIKTTTILLSFFYVDEVDFRLNLIKLLFCMVNSSKVLNTSFLNQYLKSNQTKFNHYAT